MAEKFPPTEEQQRVIDLCDRTLLLSAAAGSGKTKTLTNRLIHMITRKEDPLDVTRKEKPLDVTRMLVTTFTRAAAEELRTRIAEALKEAVAENPSDSRLKKQLLLLPTARIRTINAFCNDLVKGHTEALGISPLYRIADEAEIDLVGITLLDDLIEDAYSGAYAPAGLDIAMLVEIAETVKGAGTLAESLYSLYKSHLHDLRDGVARLHRDSETLKKEASLPFFETRAGKALARHYKETALHARALLSNAGDALLSKFGKDNPIFSLLAPRYIYLLSFAERIAEACDSSYEALGALASDYLLPKCKSCPPKYEYAPEEERYKRLIGTTDHTLKQIFAALAWKETDLAYAFTAASRVTESLHLLLCEFEERFTAEKKRRAICDHGDIMAYAYELLVAPDGTPTALALELRDSFDAVCIDEYQDVNEAQHRIFEAISTEKNLFMVGDIKQSIYAFRGAVPDIFARLRTAFPAPEAEDTRAVLYLTRNFRSEEPIISFANGVFDFLFPIIGDAIGYVEEDRLNTEKEKGSVPLPTFYLLKKESQSKTDAGEKEESAPKRTEDNLIAEKVLDLLQNGYLANGKKITPKDIAILSRNYPYALVNTLQAYGIPLKTTDKTDFFSRREILLALCLTHAVNNPHRDIYLGGLLRSPLYGFTLDDLTVMREEAPDGTLYDALVAHSDIHPEDEKARRVLYDLHRFRAMAENLPSHRLIRTLFRETGIYAATDASGRANLRSFYELARSFEASAFRGLYRFLDHVTEMMAYGKGMPERDTGSQEAVTVCTIHKAKGLEYPVCIIADIGNELKKSDKTVFRFTEELGALSAVLSKDGRALLSTPLLAAHSVVKKKREIEEEVRVLYVALTRPKERLYLFCSTQRKLTETMLEEAEYLRLAPSVCALHTYATYATWMLAALKTNPALFRLVTLPPPYLLEPETASEPPKGAGAKRAKRRRYRARFCFSHLFEAKKKAFERLYTKRFSFVYPHEKETLLPAKLSVSTLYPGVLDEIERRSPFDPDPTTDSAAPEAGSEAFKPTRPAFLSDKEEDEAAKAGTATHLFLQFCDFNRILTTNDCQEEVITEELDRLCERKFMTLDDARRVRTDELTMFLSSDLRNQIAEAKECKREFRFHVMLPAEDFSFKEDGGFDGLSVFAQGVIDLLVLRADGSILLVDYKTDRLKRGISDAEAADLLFTRHGTQLSVYARAVAQIFGRAPDVAIYSLPLGKLLYSGT